MINHRLIFIWNNFQHFYLIIYDDVFFPSDPIEIQKFNLKELFFEEQILPLMAKLDNRKLIAIIEF